MASGIIISLIILSLIIASVRERVRQGMLRDKDWGSIGETKTSKISEALTNLIGVAGGIYLSLVVITIFLELQLPEWIQIFGYRMEPLAAFSILIALVYPFLQKAANSWRRI